MLLLCLRLLSPGGFDASMAQGGRDWMSLSRSVSMDFENLQRAQNPNVRILPPPPPNNSQFSFPQLFQNSR